MNKQLVALSLLVLIAGVALVGLIRLDSQTGMFLVRGNLVLTGGIYDQNGYVLYTNKQTRMQSLMNSIVARDLSGRIVGTGQVSPGYYKLTLSGDWRNNDVLAIQVGNYNAARPDQNRLQDCTVLYVQDLLARPGYSSGRMPMDFYCDFNTMQKATTMMYR